MKLRLFMGHTVRCKVQNTVTVVCYHFYNGQNSKLTLLARIITYVVEVFVFYGWTTVPFFCRITEILFRFH